MLCMISSMCLRMRASQALHSRENSGEDGRRFGHTRILPRTPVSFMLVTMLISAVGVNRTLLRRLLGGWAFALRREVFASLDVCYTAATSLPPRRRRRLIGVLLDELLLVAALALLLVTNLRAEPCDKLYATDAFRSGAGGCFASHYREDWIGLHDLAKEKRKHVRLIWNGEEPPSNLHDVRAAAAPLALKLKWTTLFSCRFFAGKHSNLLKLESLISLLMRIAREGIRAQQLLVLVESRVVLGAVSKGRSSSRKIFLRKLGYGVSLLTSHWSWYGCPLGRIRPMPLYGTKPIESWYASLPELRPSPTAALASAHALSELDLLREPLSAALTYR